MKHLFLSFGLFILTVGSALPHGLGGDPYAPDNERPLAHERQGSLPEKSFAKPFDAKFRWWSASLATGWTSREMHYGVDETGPYGAYTTELPCVSRDLS